MYRAVFRLAVKSSSRACRAVLLAVSSGLFGAPLASALPDLKVVLEAPKRAPAGTDIGADLSVVVHNIGSQTAPGSESSGGGYVIDLFLTRGAMPTGLARYSESYFDGVLLKGGRISNTSDLPPGRRLSYKTNASLPPDTPAGSYRLCARVDPGENLREGNEGNNTACVPLTVGAAPVVVPERRWAAMLADRKRLENLHLELRPQAPVRPLPKPVAAAQPTSGGSARRSVLEDGTLVVAYPDGSERRRRPDGTTEYVAPDGSVMVPYAIQVQGADLPQLPGALAQWGNSLADDLMTVLDNILTSAEMQAYLRTEAGKDYYELVDWRLRSIQFLTLQDSGK